MDDRAIVDVLLLQSTDGTVGRRLTARSDALAVETVGDGSAITPDAVEVVDCLVVATDDADMLSVLELADSTPTVAFVDSREGLGCKALAAGADAVVTAGGPDQIAILAHRIETAVDHRRTVEGLRETAGRFEALTQNTSFAVVTIDSESIVQYASPAITDIFGYEPDELVGESLTELMPERFHEPHQLAVHEYLTTGERTLEWDWIELPGQHRDGREVPLGVSFGENVTPDGHRFSAVIRDISERKAREEELDQMASAIEGSMDGVAILDDGVFQYVNDAHLEIYGYDDRDALLGKTWRCLYDTGETERFEQEIMPIVDERGQWRGEAMGQAVDGSTFPHELSLTRLDDGGLVCVVRNVSDRVERRRELQEERQFVETVIDTLPDVFYVIGTDGTLQRWNDQFRAVTGYSDDELDGMEALRIIPPEERDLVSRAISTVFEGGNSESIQSELLTKQGDRIPYEFSGSRITNADGETIGLAGIGRDISDRVVRQQRLAVLSRVLRHNVRNRTTVIQGQADYVRRQIEDERFDQALERIEAAATEMATTSERARQAERILRDGTVNRKSVDLVELVEQVIDAVEGGNLCIEATLPDSATVVGTTMVADAVTELLENVRRHVPDPMVRVSIEEGTDTAAVVVEDNGCGIPSHEQQALTGDTDSSLSHSTGLGLWLVRWIVTVAGGQRTQFRLRRIDIESVGMLSNRKLRIDGGFHYLPVPDTDVRNYSFRKVSLLLSVRSAV